MELLGSATTNLILLMIIAAVAADYPGVKMRVTQPGLNYVSQLAETTIRDKLQNLRIEDQSGSENKLTWSLTNIQIGSVIGPNIQITLNPGNGGLTFSISNFGISLRADWRASYKIIFKIKASGSVNVDVSGSSLTVTVGLGQQGGQPSVTPRECSSNIGDFNIKFHGGLAAAILNLFKGKLADRFKSILQSKVCDLVNGFINNNGNKELAKMKVNVSFAKHFLLDYGLVTPPTVTSTYLEVPSKGAVYWKDNRQESPFSADPIPPWDEVNNMLYIFISKYAVNTFLDQAQRNQYLRYNITINDLPFGQTDILNSPAQVENKYPKSWIEFRVISKAVPSVKMELRNLTVSAIGEVEVVAHTQDATFSVLTLLVSATIIVQPTIANEKLTATIVGHNVDVAITSSDVGEEAPENLKVKIDKVMDIFIIPQLNKYGQKGIDLPVTGDLSFYNSRLSVENGFMVVSTDARYK